MKGKAISTGIVLLLCLLTATAEAKVPKRLSIEQAIDLGLAYSKQLKINQAAINISATKYKQELGALAPVVAVNSSVTHNSENIPFISDFQLPGFPPAIVPATTYNYYLNRLNISEVVFAGLRGWRTLAMTKEQVRASQYDLAVQKLNTRNQIVTAYYNYYKLLESGKVVAENIKVMQQRLKDAQNQVAAGMALKNDVLKVDLSLANLKQNEAEILNAIEVSNFNLAIMLGLPDTTDIEIADEGLLSDKPEFDLMGNLQGALHRRPEIKAADTRLDISHKQLKVARGLYSPVISGVFNFYYDQPNQREFFESNLMFNNSWDIGVRLSWNITNLFTTQFQTTEAKINIKQAEVMHDQLADNIKMEVNANYSAYKLAVDKILLNKQTVEQALENRRMTKDQYANGIKNITDMLDADNLVTVSQINLLNSRIDAEIAYANLMKSTAN